jgi:glutathione synthase/RimK-type ligase-like ATP-grasp enzyme
MGRSDVADGQLLVFRGDGRTVYRLLHRLNPSEDDWRSNYERGAKPRSSEVFSALEHMALSMWADERTAMDVSTHFARKLGDFVAAVDLDGNEGIWFAETGSEGHMSVWGRPDALQRSLIVVKRF